MSVNGSAAKALCEQGAETFPKATALQHLSSRLVKAGHAAQVVMAYQRRRHAPAKVKPISNADRDRLMLILAGYSAAVVSLIGTVVVLAVH